MSASHTPGPWDTWAHKNRWRIDSPVPRDMEDGQRWLVAETLTDNPEDEANARLIAAAPELLNALQLVAAHYPHWASHFTEQQIDRDTIRLVRAAIAKSEGAL